VANKQIVLSPYKDTDPKDLDYRTVMFSYDPATEEVNLSRFQETVHSWCIRNKYLTLSTKAGASGFVAQVPSDVSSLQNILFHANFKALTHKEVNAKFMQGLRDTPGDHSVSRIFDLHIYLCTVLDAEFVIRYITKLYQSMKMVVKETDLTWEDVFTDLQILWVLHAIQNEMRAHAVL